jgi:hypothetical protein
MYAVRYFNGTERLKDVRPADIAGACIPAGYTIDGKFLPVTRQIKYRRNVAVRHECDARCVHATGRVMNCECQCGGKNHGIGSIAAAVRF